MDASISMFCLFMGDISIKAGFFFSPRFAELRITPMPSIPLIHRSVITTSYPFSESIAIALSPVMHSSVFL